MEIGERIRKARKQKGLTQPQLGDKVNVSSQVVSNWERGYTTPDSDDITRVAKVLGISTDYLHGIIDEPTPISKEERKKENDINIAFYDFEGLTEEQKEILQRQIEMFKKMNKDK